MKRARFLAVASFLGAAFLVATYRIDVDVKVRSGAAVAKTADLFWEEGAPGPTAGRPETFADLAEKLSPTVVNIQTERATSEGRGSPEELFEEFFGRKRPRRGPRYRPDST